MHYDYVHLFDHLAVYMMSTVLDIDDNLHTNIWPYNMCTMTIYNCLIN